MGQDDAALLERLKPTPLKTLQEMFRGENLLLTVPGAICLLSLAPFAHRDDPPWLLALVAVGFFCTAAVRSHSFLDGLYRDALERAAR